MAGQLEPFKQDEDNWISSWLQGEINIKYKDLVKVFGEPHRPGDGYKVDAEWIFMSPKGVVTIYNYKDGKNYMGKEGLPVKEITDWHIGGNDPSAVKYVMEALDGTE